MYCVERISHDGRGKREASSMFGPVATWNLAQALADELTSPKSYCKLYVMNVPKRAFVVPEMVKYAEDYLEPSRVSAPVNQELTEENMSRMVMGSKPPIP